MVIKKFWRREWLPTQVFLHGEFHGQRSLAGYSPWSHKEFDMTKEFSLHYLLAHRKSERVPEKHIFRLY